MFEKLRNAFSVAVKSFGDKELKEKDIDEVLFELEVALLESDVATEVIDALKDDLKKQLIGATVNKDKIAEVVKQELRKSISNMFDVAGTVDILSNIQKKKDGGEPYIISFMGINGTGKTTTIAKIANLLKENKYSVVIAAADTFRAGAIEQIGEHGKRLNIKVISQNYGSDPAAVARDAVLYSKSHKIDCILIDTAGRMQTSKNLMDQISKINKVVNPDLKLFVGDSLAGNDTVSQAREFHNYTKFDGAILTKSDADARGGSAISIVKVTSSPILYLGIGQEYNDLKSFDKDVFLETLFGPAEVVESVQKKIQEPKVELKPEPKVELKPEPKVELKPEPKVELKPEPKVELKPEPKVELKPEPKVELKPEPKVELKPEPKVELKPEPKVELKPEPKVELKPEPKVELKPEPKVELKPEIIVDKKQEKQITEEDPFTGISTKDIEKYSDLFNIPPPENDDQARKLASDIKKWISEGRPKKQEQQDELKTSKEEIEEIEDEKPKKKRSLFGWMKK